jgi:hypothetical protein
LENCGHPADITFLRATNSTAEETIGFAPTRR